jgi:hypothetical protein
MLDLYKPPLSRQLPAVIYHYTCREALLGIIQKQALWATNIRYLNDSREFNAAIEVAGSVLDEILANALENYKKTALESFRSWLAPQNNMQFQAYVCSFSENGDLLSQWRTYSKAGDGYAIGFDAEALMKLTAGQGFLLAPCTYDESEQRQLISNFLTDELYQLKIDTDPQGFGISCLLKFLCVAPLIKDKGFKEELEWRLVAPLTAQPPIGLSFRSGKSMVIPYIKFPLPIRPDASQDDAKIVLPIKEVIIGPSPHSLLDSMAVTQLQHINAISVACSCSRIPFRDW